MQPVRLPGVCASGVRALRAKSHTDIAPSTRKRTRRFHCTIDSVVPRWPASFIRRSNSLSKGEIDYLEHVSEAAEADLESHPDAFLCLLPGGESGVPPGVVSAEICSDTGQSAEAAYPNPRNEVFIAGTEPTILDADAAAKR
jgi:hypothetical protein